jgi:hypothetical protein
MIKSWLPSGVSIKTASLIGSSCDNHAELAKLGGTLRKTKVDIKKKHSLRKDAEKTFIEPPLESKT